MPKISQLEELSGGLLSTGDLLHVVDVSDTITMGAISGTNKKITVSSLAGGLISTGLLQEYIPAGAANQYYSGDRTWKDFNLATLGLENVENESKATMFTSPTFTGTPRSGNTTTNSLNSGALWLNGGSGALLFDNTGHKRIGWNDGGNFNIRAGNYSIDGTNDVYAVEGNNTNVGAAKITLTCDGNLADGAIDFRVAPSGAAAATITYSNHVSITKDRFTVNGTGVNVGIGTTSPGAKLNVVDSSANDAVRITQTGSGNALVVEDASNDSTPFIINSAGQITIGAGDGSVYRTIGIVTESASNVANNGNINSTRYSNEAEGVNLTLRKGRGSINAPQSVIAGDQLGNLWFSGYNGTSLVNSARISVEADAAFTSQGAPSRITFSCASAASSTLTEHMRITSAGSVGIGTTAPGAKLNVVEANSASTDDTVRITNTGTGNSFVVEDSANPDSNPFVIANNGNVTIGLAIATTDTLKVRRTGSENVVLSTDAETGVNYIVQNKFSSDGGGSNFQFRKYRGSIGSVSAVQNNDVIGSFDALGYDGVKIVNAAQISAQVDGTPSNNDMPGRLVFSTTADGASTPTERMRITNNGTVFIGNGATSGTPNSAILSATGGGGTTPDIAGASLTIRGGIGTGTGTGGSIIFNSSPASSTTGTAANVSVQRARLLPTGQLIVGSSTTAATTRFGSVDYTPNFQILSNTSGGTTELNSSSMLIGRFGGAADGTRQFFFKSRGNAAAPTIVSTNDNIGLLSFGAYDGAKAVESARISVLVSGTPATDKVAGVITLSTTPDTTNAVPNERMRIDSAGNVGIGTTSPTYQLQLGTDSAAKPSTTAWTVSSDERLKENIEAADLDICYDAVKSIPLKRYKWKDEVYSPEQIADRSKIGWIAQDVQAVFPKAVGQHRFVYNQVKDEDGNIISEDVIEDCLSLNADQLYATMYGAIQKLMNTVETLQARIDQLESSS